MPHHADSGAWENSGCSDTRALHCAADNKFSLVSHLGAKPSPTHFVLSDFSCHRSSFLACNLPPPATQAHPVLYLLALILGHSSNPLQGDPSSITPTMVPLLSFPDPPSFGLRQSLPSDLPCSPIILLTIHKSRWEVDTYPRVATSESTPSKSPPFNPLPGCSKEDTN